MKHAVKAVIAVVMLGAAAPASAQLGWSVGGGPTFDVGTDGVGNGFNAMAGAELGLPLLPLSVRFDGMLNRLKLDGIDGSYQTLSASANAIFRMGPGGITPYLIGGVGYYQTKTSVDGAGDAEQSHWGVNGGAGIRLGLGSLGVFGEARVHATKDGETRLAPVTVGVRF